ncbi:MAG TPA: IS200/IS605 family transposase [Pirellulaceae bacterium]|nr:IS200/IS605 family transposase [Pirellulaceae bacterium]
MPQSLAQIYLHIVFSTKHRKPFVQNETLCENTHAYLAGACKKLESPSLVVGGAGDHVHILCRQSKNIALKTLIAELKRESSKWLKTQGSHMSEFYWQRGYGAFSISPSHVEALMNYIANQREHHKTESFQAEFRRLCKKRIPRVRGATLGFGV